MSELQEFNSPEFGTIRSMAIDGAPWFVGKDVAQALGYKDTVNALKAHVDPDDKGGWQITTPSGIQTMTVINESGLYCLVLSSKLPGAKKFKRWVTGEVLPAIRRTGAYTAQGTAFDNSVVIRLTEELLRAKDEIMALRLAAAQREADDLRRQLEAATVPPEALERRREKNRERQRRYREKIKQAKAEAKGADERT